MQPVTKQEAAELIAIACMVLDVPALVDKITVSFNRRPWGCT